MLSLSRNESDATAKRTIKMCKVLETKDVHCAARGLPPRVFMALFLFRSDLIRAHTGRAKDKTASSPQAPRVFNKQRLCQQRRSLYCVMTLSFTFSLLLLNTPGHGLLRKKRSGTKGELTGTNQKHIRDAWSGLAPSIFIVSSRSRRLSSYCCWGFCRAVLPNLKLIRSTPKRSPVMPNF